MDESPAKRASRPVLSALFSGDRYASLRLPQYRWLLAGTSASQIANWMEEVARGWLAVEVLNASALQLSLLGFTRGITQLLVSPLAGVIAERFDRRRMAALSQAVPAADAVLIAILVGTGHIALWQLYPLVAIGGIASSVNITVRQVLVYDVVGGDYIVNAIALNAVVGNVSRIIAPTAGGVVIATIGIGASYYAQMAFFAMATLATFALHPVTFAKPIRTPLFQSIREGVSYVRHEPTMARLVLLNMIPNLLIYPYVALIPIFAKDIMHVGSAGYGVLLTGVGIGSIPGGLIVAGMTNARWKGRVMGLSACLYMVMVTLFALSSIFLLSLAILIVAGVGWSMMVTLNQTLLQLNVADEYRGRVIALYTMASGVTPFGNLGMGTLANSQGAPTAVASFALAALALVTVLGIGSKRVREL